MKVKNVFLLCALFFSFSVFAQKVIQEKEATPEMIGKFLESKGYKILEKKEKFVKISGKEDQIAYLDFDKKDEVGKKYIYLNDTLNVIDNPNKEKLEKLVKEINNLEMIKARYFEKENVVVFSYYFWITNGFTLETLDDAIQEFFLFQGDAFALDTEKLIK